MGTCNTCLWNKEIRRGKRVREGEGKRTVKEWRTDRVWSGWVKILGGVRNAYVMKEYGRGR